MPLVVNGVCRFALNGTYIDRPFVNICDMQIDTTGSLDSREEAAFDLAGRIINAWVDNIAPSMVNDGQLDSVSWVDLDSADGTTGERVSTSEYTLPVTGGGSNDPTSGNVAVLVTKATVSGRGRRNGRWYQVGPNETATGGQSLTASGLTNWQNAFNGFLEDINQELAPLEWQTQMVVVHTTGTNPQTGTYSVVRDLVVSDRLATQRRRLRA